MINHRRSFASLLALAAALVVGTGCSDDATSTKSSPTATGASATPSSSGFLVSDFPPISTSSWIVTISCPTSTFCFAADHDHIVYSLGGGIWSPTEAPQLHILSCANESMCLGIATDGDGGAEKAFVWDGGQWNSVPGGLSQVIDVTCAGDGTCLVLESSGAVSSYSNGSFVALAEMQMASDRVTSLSCSSASACVALGYDTGATSYFDGTSWTESTDTLGASSPVVSCSSDGFCSAVTYDGEFYRLDSSGWVHVGSVGSDKFENLSCPTVTECIVATGEGSDNPGKVALIQVSSP